MCLLALLGAVVWYLLDLAIQTAPAIMVTADPTMIVLYGALGAFIGSLLGTMGTVWRLSLARARKRA